VDVAYARSNHISAGPREILRGLTATQDDVNIGENDGAQVG